MSRDIYRPGGAPPTGLIEGRFRVEFQSSEFAIVDLIHISIRANWEPAIRKGRVSERWECGSSKFSEEKSRFDTNHLRVTSNDARPDDALQDLNATIRATRADPVKHRDSRRLLCLLFNDWLGGSLPAKSNSHVLEDRDCGRSYVYLF